MQFSQLASYFSRIEETASRNLITEILAELFSISSLEEIGNICYLLQGRVVPLYEAVEFGLADKFMIRAIAEATELDTGEVTALFKKHGDLGVAAEMAKKTKKSYVPLSVSDVYHSLYALAKTSGAGSQDIKIRLMAELLAKADVQSAKFLARIPLDKLRLGFSDMTILDGFSWMLAGDKSLRPRLEGAYNVRPDIGYIATTLKQKGVKGLSHVHAVVGAPILAALAQRLPTADEMIEKMGEVSVEPKYDGSRVQIHYKNGKVSSFSRNLENTTAMFPELQELEGELNASEVIVDAEAVGIDPTSRRFISFQDTMKRKRKHDIEATRASIPLQFVAFDILYKDGEDLLDRPLSERRKILEATIHPVHYIQLSPHILTDNPQVLRTYHDLQLQQGLEGVVVKKWDGRYEPGRRGYNWVKFKEEEGQTGKLTDTIDAVIMGYSRGQGKRTGFGIGMFLVGVRNGDEFVTITKVGTGVTDQMWKTLYKQLEAIQTITQPKSYINVNKLFIPDVWVLPQLIVEIAGDDLTKSPAHGAGIAIRFPRLVRIRQDKSPAQCTTVQEIRQMYEQQFSSSIGEKV